MVPHATLPLNLPPSLPPAAGRISLFGALRLICVSWWSNLVGCLLMVGLFDGARVWPGRDHYLTHLAEAKCALGWGTVVVRGERAGGGGA